MKNPDKINIHNSPNDIAEETIQGSRSRKSNEHLEVGQFILGHYKVLECLGKGSMGTVYKCFEEETRREVAVKAFNENISYDIVAIDNIRSNFQLVERLNHPNIANLKHLEKDPKTGHYYLVMEYVPGVTLKEYMKNSAISKEQKKKIVSQIAETLDFIHSKKLIHRDIKPDNIIITIDGDAKILDFGIATKLIDTVYEQTDNSLCGTAHYIAPELWSEDKSVKITSAVDLYSLAVIVFEWTYGKKPFNGVSLDALKTEIIYNTPSFPLHASFYEKIVLKRALAKSPQKRYNSCVKFAEMFFSKPLYLSQKIFAGLAILIILIVSSIVCMFISWHPELPEPFSVKQQEPIVKQKKSPRLLINCKEKIRGIDSDLLSQGLLQELALSYGFQTINPQYVKNSSSYDFVIDVTFSGAYRLDTFSFNKNLKLHAFSLGADMSATYPNGNLISQVTLPSKDFRIGKIGDAQEALRDCMHRRITSKAEVSFHDILLQILEKWAIEVKDGMSISVEIRNAQEFWNDFSKNALEILKQKGLISEYIVRNQNAKGSIVLEIVSKLQSHDLANLLATLARKKLEIHSVEYGKIILKRK